MRVAVVSGPDPGHLFPCVAVAAALGGRGHETLVVTGERWSGALGADGFAVHRLPNAAGGPGGPDIGWRIWGRAVAMARPLAEDLERFAADLVVADTLTSAGGFAAELLGLPWVEVVPHWLWAPSRFLPPVGLGLRPARNPLGRLYEAHLRRRQRESFDEGARARRAARRRLGLPPVGGPRLKLLSTLPALELPRPDWPRRTHVVGALEWEPSAWPDLDVPPGSAPLVLVTDSTVPDVPHGSLAEAVVTGLRPDAATGHVRVVATTERALPEVVGVVSGRARHAPLVSRAAVTVGGGGGLVGKSLTRGVPMLVVPLQGDQRETAARVRWTGAGTTVAAEDASPDRLRAAIWQVLTDPGYRAAASRVARESRGLGAPRAADLIERCVSTC